jgi:hypothetical protein
MNTHTTRRFPTLVAATTLVAGLSAQTLLQKLPSSPEVLPSFVSPLRGLAAADLDGDGDGDFLAAMGNDAWILTKNGGGYSAVLHFSDPQNVPSMALAGDFDGDGFQDLLFGTYGNGSQRHARIWWGDGSGQFANSPTTNVPVLTDFGTGLVTASDVDADGDLDLVFTTTILYAANSCLLMRNQGNRSFAAAQAGTFPVQASGNCAPHAIDLDGDGFDEVLVVSRTGRTRLYWNNNGNFAEASTQQFPTVTDSLRGCAVADFDRDGRLDVLFGGDVDHGVLMRGVGPRQFARVAGAAAPPRTAILVAGDHDRDGAADVYAFTNEGRRLWRNDGIGGLAPGDWASDCERTQWAVLCDLDADGDQDVVSVGEFAVPSAPPAPRVAAAIQVAPGVLHPLAAGALSPLVRAVGASVGNLQGDVRDDLALFADERISNNTYSMLQAGNGSAIGVFAHEFVSRLQHAGPDVRSRFLDLDGDGKDEFVEPRWGTYFQNVGGTLAAAPTPLPAVVGAHEHLDMADIDGDGIDDLLVVVRNGSLSQLRVFANRAGQFVDESATRVQAPAVAGNHLRIATADLDGDGSTDVWIVSTDGHAILLNNNGVLQFLPGAIPSTLPIGVLPTFTHIVDLDGDGDADLQYERYLLFNNGNGTFVDASWRIPLANQGDRFVAVRDLDDDGDIDLLTIGGAVWNNGDGTFVSAANVFPPFSLNGATTVWVDIDRDLDVDAIVKTSFPERLEVYTNMLRQLECIGRPRVGGSWDLRYTATAGQHPAPAFAWLAYSYATTSPRWLPEIGWSMLDPTMLIAVGGWPLPPAGGTIVRNEPIPNLVAFRGVWLHAQPIELRNGQFRIGNLVTSRIDG